MSRQIISKGVYTRYNRSQWYIWFVYLRLTVDPRWLFVLGPALVVVSDRCPLRFKLRSFSVSLRLSRSVGSLLRS